VEVGGQKEADSRGRQAGKRDRVALSGKWAHARKGREAGTYLSAGRQAEALM
jgi:hypothetical protein